MTSISVLILIKNMLIVIWKGRNCYFQMTRHLRDWMIWKNWKKYSLNAMINCISVVCFIRLRSMT